MSVLKLKFKDGDEDGGENSVESLQIRHIDNAMLLRISTVEEEWEEAYMSKSELLARIEEIL